MKRVPGFAAVCAFLLGSQFAVAHVLYEDTFYWVPNGTAGGLGVSVVMNPTTPPPNAYVKLQETVYDDQQGRQVLSQSLGAGSIHGSAIPAPPINLYVYSITNLTYGNGPVVGGGNGVSGYNIVNQFNIPTLGIWGSTAAASFWEVPSGNQPFPANWNWDIDANNNSRNGDGFGILLGQTFDGMMVAVPDGTTHGVVPAYVNTWSGGGALEQPLSTQVDILQGGMVSGPVPEPGTIALVSLAAMTFLLRKQRS